MQIPSLLTPLYWFKTTPPPLMAVAQKGVLIFFAACVVAGVIIYLMRLKKNLDKFSRRGMARIGTALLTMGGFGLALLFFEFERIPVLTMRALYLVWLILAAWWGYSIFRYITVKIPEIRKQREDRENFNKWLPKGKG
ncbi:MAG: hypothetical protein WC641_07465 [Patescibacteria group bacterium]